MARRYCHMVSQPPLESAFATARRRTARCRGRPSPGAARGQPVRRHDQASPPCDCICTSGAGIRSTAPWKPGGASAALRPAAYGSDACTVGHHAACLSRPRSHGELPRCLIPPEVQATGRPSGRGGATRFPRRFTNRVEQWRTSPCRRWSRHLGYSTRRNPSAGRCLHSA